MLEGLGGETFGRCSNLTSVRFKGSAPSDASPFYEAPKVIVYYLPGTSGWGSTFGGRPTAPWLLPYPVILTTPPNFGIQTNGFGFTVSWATNASVVVEAIPTLTMPTWSPVSTNALTDGWTDFRDPEWANSRSRFYRVRSQ